MATIRFEQAVYGSFPFWDRGYALLAASPGCDPTWLAEFQAACQRYGEPPPGLAAPEAMFSLRLPCGVWAVVGVGPQGHDDRGRPGALAFHALFLSRREFARAAYDPFALTGALRRQWDAQTTSLDAGSIEVAPDPASAAQRPTPSDEGRRIAEALARGRRVVVESSAPIDRRAREAWHRLPSRTRRRASLATLAHSAANRFDLLALPRLAGVDLDPSYRTLADLDATTPRSSRRSVLPLLGVLGLLAVVAIGLALALRPARQAVDPPGESPAAEAPIESPTDAAPPIRTVSDPREVDPEERSRVVEALLDFAARFDVAFTPSDDPAPIMTALAEQLRYRGPWLSAAELGRLRREATPEAARALADHEHLRHFTPDRPLPPDFARGPLDWQLRSLAWSFRVVPHPGWTPAEMPFALADALARDGPARPNPLSDRFPPLAEYTRFLARLPRR